MIFEVLCKTVMNPKKIINSDLCNKYSLISMHMVVLGIHILLSLMIITIDFFDEFEIVDCLYAIYGAVVSTCKYVLNIYIPIFLLYVFNRMCKGNYMRFGIINRYMFPFYAMYTIIKNLILLLLLCIGISAEMFKIVGNIVNLGVSVSICYPIYVLFDKYKITKNKIYFILIVYIVAVILGVG